MKANVSYLEWFEDLPEEIKKESEGLLQLDLKQELKFAYLKEQLEQYGEVTGLFHRDDGQYEVYLRPHQNIDYVQLNFTAQKIFDAGSNNSSSLGS
jgi:hypothetical protein